MESRCACHPQYNETPKCGLSQDSRNHYIGCSCGANCDKDHKTKGGCWCGIIRPKKTKKPPVMLMSEARKCPSITPISRRRPKSSSIYSNCVPYVNGPNVCKLPLWRRPVPADVSRDLYQAEWVGKRRRA